MPELPVLIYKKYQKKKKKEREQIQSDPVTNRKVLEFVLFFLKKKIFYN